MSNDNIHISVSQIWLYIKSPQQWAGKYILGMKDDYKAEALEIGSMFHKRVEVCKGKSIWDEASATADWLIEGLKQSYKDDEAFLSSAVETFYILRNHFEHYDDTGIVEREKKVEGKLYLKKCKDSKLCRLYRCDTPRRNYYWLQVGKLLHERLRQYSSDTMRVAK